jgi:phage N-6-adenine-methyltransferase
MPTSTNRRTREISVKRKMAVPTLSQIIRDGQASSIKIKRATKEVLIEWIAQSERLNIARQHYALRGERFIDFAGRIGIDQASAYQLVKLWRHRTAVLARCADEGRYYGWEHCLYWFERDPRLSWHRSRHGSHTDEYGTPPTVFRQFGSPCTLDVCATTDRAMCTKFFTKEQDDLKRSWNGTVWMNPPYSDINSWCRKAYEYARAGGTVIALLPAWTDADWFHDFVSYGRITFIRGKLSFVGRKGFSWFPSMVVE